MNVLLGLISSGINFTNVNISHILTPKWPNFLKLPQAKMENIISPACA